MRRREPLEERLNQVVGELQEAEANAERAASDLLSHDGQEISVLDKSKRAQEALKRLERREAELDREKALTEQRIGFLEQESSDAERKRDSIVARIKTAQEQAANAAKQTDQLNKSLDEARKNCALIGDRISRITKRLNSIRTNVDRLRREEAEIRSELDAARMNADRRGEDMQRLTDKQNALQTRLKDQKKKKERTEAKLIELQQQHDTVVEKQNKFRRDQKSAEQNLVKANDGYKVILSARTEAVAGLEAIKIALQAHKARSTDVSTLPGELRRAVEEADLHKLADRIQCKPEHRMAIATAL